MSVELVKAEVKNGKAEVVVKVIMRGESALPLEELLRAVKIRLLKAVRSPAHEI